MCQEFHESYFISFFQSIWWSFDPYSYSEEAEVQIGWGTVCKNRAWVQSYISLSSPGCLQHFTACIRVGELPSEPLSWGSNALMERSLLLHSGLWKASWRQHEAYLQWELSYPWPFPSLCIKGNLLGNGLSLGILTDFMELLFWGRLDSEHYIFQYLVPLLEWEISQQREEA